MNDSLADSPRSRTPLIVGGLVIGGILLLLIPTCRGPSNSKTSVTRQDTSIQDSTREQCQRALEGVLDGLRPHRLGISSESRVLIDSLNNWLGECAPAAGTESNTEDLDLRKQLLSESALASSEMVRFQEWDAEHIRNSLLARAIVDTVTVDLTTDRERAVELFYYVIRTVQLLPDTAVTIPLTPYETLLFGEGTAADRAWTYAELLRQLRLDCVILQPQAQQGVAPYWILGVVIPGEGIDLFDPRLGLPIAVSDDGTTPLPRQPASLSQVLESDDLLRQFDFQGTRYPLSAEDLKSVEVMAIGTSSTWAPRLERLQLEFAEPVELYDGLAAHRLRATGLHQRLVNAGSGGLWEPDQVRIWPYPESHWADTNPLTNEQQKELTVRLRVLDGPYDIKERMTDGNPEYYAENSERYYTMNAERTDYQEQIKQLRTLHEARIKQLVGSITEAQPFYIRCRIKLQDFQRIPLPEVQLNYLAAGMATYWGAQSLFEQGEYQAAVDSAQLYLKRSNAQFLLSAVYLQSLGLAHLDRRGEAAQLLAGLPPQAPQFLGNQKLVARWQKPPAGESDPTPDTSGEADQTDQEKPRETSPDDGDTSEQE